MWPESDESPRPLKTGLTTGCCATACCVAAAQYLLTGQATNIVSVTLPKGKIVELTITDNHQLTTHSTRAATVKDAGDDPDVTHGATVFVELVLKDEKGVTFHAAKGVGTVTRAGLSLAVSEPAINPVPRQMMNEHLEHISDLNGYDGGFEVWVGVENGEQIALKTMNGRLGIIGGLSILGTTGIVRPFSCSAYIASIYQGLDVATTNGHSHVAATTGNRSEQAISDYYQLDEMALIEMGDFVGAVLSHAKKLILANSGLKKLSICGGFGKISKLAMGKWNLHSQASSIDLTFLADLAKARGANEDLIEAIIASNTSIEALGHCFEHKIDLAQAVCQAALNKVDRKLNGKVNRIELEVWVIDRQGNLIGFSGNAAG